MKQRLLYLLKFYLLVLLVFVIQKPIFLWTDVPEGHTYGLADAFSVMVHGLLLDVPVAGYLVALPLLFVIVSAWIPAKIPFRKIALPYNIVVALAICLVFVADLSLYPFWKFKLDATIFYYIDSPKDAFASVSVGYLACRLLAIAAYTALVAFCFVKIAPRTLFPMPSAKAKVGLTLTLVILIAPLVVSIRGGLGESTANIGKVYFSEDEYLNHSAVNPCFSLIASLDKTENFADEFNYLPEAERSQLFAALYPGQAAPADTVSLLNTRRPNVIVILMESFGGQFVEAVSGRADIAPNYNRLAKEGVFFTHCYSNSFRTDRGTVSTLSGYPSFPTLSVMKLPVKSRTLPCLANSLNEAGYQSSFLYGGDINFTNMQSYLRTGGYGTIVSDVDFSAADKKDNPWGANDDKTFDRLFQMIGSQRHTPWHIGYLTLSSHEPFEVPYHRLKEQIPNAFAFTDECLGRFIERIRKTPVWNNLLIVCIPDHGFHYPSTIDNETHHHNTMLWLGGAVKRHAVVSTLMNQSDMAATLLGQLGIDHSSYTFSRDVFSQTYLRYPFAFFTDKEGFGFVDSTGCSYYDIPGNKTIIDRSAGHVPDKKENDLRIRKAKAIIQSFYDDIGKR